MFLNTVSAGSLSCPTRLARTRSSRSVSEGAGDWARAANPPAAQSAATMRTRFMGDETTRAPWCQGIWGELPWRASWLLGGRQEANMPARIARSLPCLRNARHILMLLVLTTAYLPGNVWADPIRLTSHTSVRLFGA